MNRLKIIYNNFRKYWVEISTTLGMIIVLISYLTKNIDFNTFIGGLISIITIITSLKQLFKKNGRR
jgi:hypothetical protein